MSDSIIENLPEQLRAQGLTWRQTNFVVSLLRAELAASREREARMQWQPIETAPTDGARILLCGKGGKIADGYYGQPDGFANPKQFV